MSNTKIDKIIEKDLLLSLDNGKLKLICKILKQFSKSDLKFALKNLEAKKDSLSSEEVFYTSKEICGIFKISPSTLERNIRKGLKCYNNGTKTKRLFTITDYKKFKND